MADALLSRVLRPIVSKTLHKVLGSFFDLGSSATTLKDLDLQVLKGVLVLLDLKTRKRTLRLRNGTVRVEMAGGGTVDRVEIKIPWANLASERCRVEVRGIRVECKVITGSVDTSADGITAEAVLREAMEAELELEMELDDAVEEEEGEEGEGAAEDGVSEENSGGGGRRSRTSSNLSSSSNNPVRSSLFRLPSFRSSSSSSSSKLPLPMLARATTTTSTSTFTKKPTRAARWSDQIMNNLELDCHDVELKIVLQVDDALSAVVSLGHVHMDTSIGSQQQRQHALSLHQLDVSVNGQPMLLSPIRSVVVDKSPSTRLQVSVPDRVLLPPSTALRPVATALLAAAVTTTASPRLSFKQCADRVLAQVRRRRRMWLIACEALRTRTRFLALSKTGAVASAELLRELERQLPVRTVLLFRCFAHELGKKQRSKRFTLSRRHGLARKKTTQSEAQELFEMIANERSSPSSLSEAAAMQWRVEFKGGMDVPDYGSLADVVVLDDASFTAKAIESHLPWIEVLTKSREDEVAVVRGDFAARQVSLQCPVRIKLPGGADVGVRVDTVKASSAKQQQQLTLFGCTLSNDANQTSFECSIVRRASSSSSSVVAVDITSSSSSSTQGFSLDCSAVLPRLRSPPSSASTSSSLDLLSCVSISCALPVKLRLLDGGECELSLWDSCANNTTTGRVQLRVDDHTILSVDGGLQLVAPARVTLLGAASVAWGDKISLAKLATLLLPPSTSSRAPPSLPSPRSVVVESAHPLRVAFLAPGGNTDFLTLHCGTGFRAASGGVELNDCVVTSYWQTAQQPPLGVFETSGAVRFVPGKSATCAGQCSIIAQQSFWLEVNDYLQTQVLPVMRRGDATASPFELQFQALAGCVFRLFPTPFLPTTSAAEEAHVRLRCGSVKGSVGNSPAFHSHAVLTECSVAHCTGVEEEPVCSHIDLIEYTMQASAQVLAESTVSLPPLAFGVRRHGPFAPARSVSVSVRVASTSSTKVHLAAPHVRSTVQRVVDLALRDLRRVQPKTPAQADEWHTVLYPRTPPDEPFLSVDSATGAGALSLFRRFELVFAGAIEVSAGAAALKLPTGVLFTSQIMYRATQPGTLIRVASLRVLNASLVTAGDSDSDALARIPSLELDRMSVGFGHDERYELRLPGGVDVAPPQVDATGLAALAAAAAFSTSSSPSPSGEDHNDLPVSILAWAKLVRVVAFKVRLLQAGDAPVAVARLKQDALFLRSRIRGEYAYSLQVEAESPFLLLEPVTMQADGMAAAGTVQRSLVVSKTKLRCTLRQLDTLLGHARALQESVCLPSSTSTTARAPRTDDSDTTWVVSLAAFQLELALARTQQQPVLQIYGSQVIVKRVGAVYSATLSQDERGACGLGVNYYNQPLARWEPLLEQTQCSLELERTGGGGGGVQRVRASIEVLGAVQLNVSVAAVDTLCDVMEAAEAVAAASIINSRNATSLSTAVARTSPPATAATEDETLWTFCNDSGEAVDVSTSAAAQEEKDDDGKWIRVETAARAALGSRCRAIRIASGLFRPIAHVPSDVGSYECSLYPSYSSSQPRRETRLVTSMLEITAGGSGGSDGHFTIRLSSNVRIENQLEVPIELLLAPRIEDDEVIGKSAVMGPVPALGGALAVPIQCIDSRLCIRPLLSSSSSSSSSSASGWWTGMDLVDLDAYYLQHHAGAGRSRDDVTPDEVVYGECDGGEFAFQVRVQHVGRGRFVLVFMPLATVLNALPIDLEFRLGAVQRRVLKSGERGGLCTAVTTATPTRRNRVKLHFRVVGSAWSAPVDVATGEDDDDDEEGEDGVWVPVDGRSKSLIRLEDTSGKEVTLILERFPYNVFMLSARVWFRNLSDVSLSYRASSSSASSSSTAAAVGAAGESGGGGLFAFGSATGSGEDGDDAFKIGSVCEYRLGGDDDNSAAYGGDEEEEEASWVQAVVVGSSKRGDLHDVVLVNATASDQEQERRRKITNVPRHRLRVQLEYVMYNEPSGMVQVKLQNDSSALWCAPFSVETGEGVVLMLPSYSHVVALTVSIGSMYLFDQQQRITLVTLTNRHLVVNDLFHDDHDANGGGGLCLCIKDEASAKGVQCEYFDGGSKQQHRPLHLSKPAVVRFSVERVADRHLPPSAQLTRSGFAFSGAVNVSQPCEEAIKIQNKRTGEMYVLKVLVEWGENNALVVRVAAKSTSSPPLYFITNRTASELLHYHQAVTQAAQHHTLVERLFPGESLEFGWDVVTPADSPRVIEFVLFSRDGKLAVYPDELQRGEYRAHGLRVRLRLEGVTKRIIVEDDDDNKEADTFALSLPVPPTHAAAAVEHVLRCFVQSLVVSFVDSFPQELICVHVTEFSLTLQRQTTTTTTTTSAASYSLQVETRYLQVDNAVLNARLPVVLWPVRAHSPHFAQLMANWTVDEHIVLCSLLHCSIELFDLFVDEKLVLLALRMWKECARRVTEVKPVNLRVRHRRSSTSGGGEAGGGMLVRRVFVEQAQIAPIAFTVTVQTLVEPFSASSFPRWRGPGTAKTTTTTSSSASAADIDSSSSSSLRIALTDVDRATVVLPAVVVKRMFTTMPKFASTVRRKYHEELLANVSRILSQEFMRIVSPIGGTIRVEEDGSQLLHGAFNTLNAASKITGTIGTGAAMLTLDPAFIASRRQAMIDEQPDGLGSGVLLAAKALSSNIVLGLAGIVYQPVMGAAEHGVAGFFSGLGRGLVGAGVRPVVGVFDMISTVLSGARSATAWLDPSEAPRRARLPRAMGGASRALEPYDDRAALVQELVIKVWGDVDRWHERGGDCDYLLLESDSLVLIRVSDYLLVCIDFSDYAALLMATTSASSAASTANKHITMASINATRPVLAWEIDGKACASSFYVDNKDTVVVALTHFHTATAATAAALAGEEAEDGNAGRRQDSGGGGVSIGYGRAAGVVSWEADRWVLRLPTFSQQGREFVCHALERVMRGNSLSGGGGGVVSAAPSSTFGLSTTTTTTSGDEEEKDGGGRCVVSGVEPGSMAERAGFGVGDVIVSFWGRRLCDATGAELHHAIRDLSSSSSQGRGGAWLDVLVERGQVKQKLVIKF